MSTNGDVSLYFHIPFCNKKCPYCHFYVLKNVLKNGSDLKKVFLSGLEKEWDFRKIHLQNKKIVSIYFGGGTPSLFLEGIAHLLNWIRKNNLKIEENIEITLEANPEDLNEKTISTIFSLGINRLSIGVQSLDDSSLHVLGRNHSAKNAFTGVLLAYEKGISNISIDLMYELPKQTLKSWRKTLQNIKDLPITHLSLYNLTFEPKTLFFKKKEFFFPLLPSSEEKFQMLEMAVVEIEKMGLKRYEVSAFAKKGYESRHNLGYWTARPFLGFGPSAFSYLEKRRFRNICNLQKYVKLLEAKKDPIDFEEKLSYPQNLKELLAINLRILSGVDLKKFQKKHAAKIPKEILKTLQQLENEGFLLRNDSLYKLSDKGLLFYDSVAEEII